jgi:hypothetical protein
VLQRGLGGGGGRQGGGAGPEGARPQRQRAVARTLAAGAEQGRLGVAARWALAQCGAAGQGRPTADRWAPAKVTTKAVNRFKPIQMIQTDSNKFKFF